MMQNLLLDKLKERDGTLVYICMPQIATATQILLRNDWAANFHRLLRTDLVSNGYCIELCDDARTTISLGYRWTRFFELAVTNLLISGVVAFEFTQEGEPLIIMFECPDTRIDLVTSRTIRLSSLKTDWMVVRNLAKRNQPHRYDIDTNAFVFVGTDAPNTCTGELFSIARSISGQCTLHTTRVTSNIVENILRANPPLILQQESTTDNIDIINQTIASVDDAEVLVNNLVAARMKLNEDERCKYEKERERAAEEMEKLTHSLTEGVIRTPSMHMFHLPAGEKLVPFPMAPPRSDFDDNRKAFGKYLASAFGIPLAMLDGDFAGGRERSSGSSSSNIVISGGGGDSHAIFERYLLTLEMWEQQLSRLLLFMLNARQQIFGGTVPVCRFVSKRVLEIQQQLKREDLEDCDAKIV